MNAVTMTNDAGAIMESVIAKGDLAKLSPQERNTYYMQVCRSIGLNPLTRPFEYLTLNGKTVLYARRDAADQLRKINNISIEIVSKAVDEGLLTIHVRAKDGSGRIDEDYGVVNVGALKGEAAANAFLKAVTKAKRRVTLSISGLGFLDETEVDDIPASAKRAPAHEAASQASVAANGRPQPAPLALAAPTPVDVNPETGEVGPRALPVPERNGKPDYIAFGQAFLAAVRAAQTPDDVNAWGFLNQQTIAHMKQQAPKVYARLIAAIEPPPAEDDGDIPASIRRTPKAATADDVFDGAAWLKELDAKLAACTTGEEFFAVERSLFKPNLERALPPDVKKANKIREEHYTRIIQAMDAA